MNNGFISEEFASLKQRLSNINGVVSLREIPRKRKTKTRQRTLTSHSDQNMINNVVLIIQRLVFEVLKERSSNIRQFQKNRHRRGINPVSKIDKAVFFWRFCPMGSRVITLQLLRGVIQMSSRTVLQQGRC